MDNRLTAQQWTSATVKHWIEVARPVCRRRRRGAHVDFLGW